MVLRAAVFGFVDSGVHFDKDHDENYNLRKLIDDFLKSGGTFYRNENRDVLEKGLLQQFGGMVQPYQIENISRNDRAPEP